MALGPLRLFSPDRSLLLARQGYLFTARLKEDERRKLYEIGALGIRFLGRPALAVTGAVGVDLFYAETACSWDNPWAFDPERFMSTDPFAIPEFIPQGGGPVDAGHRCPGEGFSNGLLALTVQFLAEIDDIDLSQQDRHFSMRRMPTRPASGTRMALEAPQQRKRYA